MISYYREKSRCDSKMEQPRRQTIGHATWEPMTETLSAPTRSIAARAICDSLYQLVEALSELLGREMDLRDLQDIAEGKYPTQDLYDDLPLLEDEDDSGELATEKDGGYQRVVKLLSGQPDVTLTQHLTRNASDLKQECRTCSTAFTLTANEKNAFEALSSHQPTHCSTCRLRRRDLRKERTAWLLQKRNQKRTAAPTDDRTETCMGKTRTLHAQADRPEQTAEQPGAPPRAPTPKMQTAPRRTTLSLDCQDCDGQFPFPRLQQLMFAAKGWGNPIRCQNCRVINNQSATKGQAGAARPTPPPARPKTTRPVTHTQSANATARRTSMAAAAASLEASNAAAAASLIANSATEEKQRQERQATQRRRTPAPAAESATATARRTSMAAAAASLEASNAAALIANSATEEKQRQERQATQRRRTPAPAAESAKATARRSSMAAAAASLEAGNAAAAAALIASNATAETQRPAMQRPRTLAPAAHEPLPSDAHAPEDLTTQEIQAPLVGLTSEQKRQRTLAKEARKLSAALAKQEEQERTRAANLNFAAARQSKNLTRATAQQATSASSDRARAVSAAVRKEKTATVLRNAERAAKQDRQTQPTGRATGRRGGSEDHE